MELRTAALLRCEVVLDENQGGSESACVGLSVLAAEAPDAFCPSATLAANFSDTTVKVCTSGIARHPHHKPEFSETDMLTYIPVAINPLKS